MDNNRSNQMNSNNPSYWSSRGYEGKPSGDERSSYQASHPTPDYGKHDVDNRSNQMNPNNSSYSSSRGPSSKR